MSLTYVGSLSLAALVPVVYLSIGGVSVSFNADLTGNLTLSASLQAQPPTVDLELGSSTKIQASFDAAISAFPPVPSISFQVSDTVALSAGVGVSLNLLLSLEALLGANVGIYGYGYNGTGNTLGTAISAALASTWPDGAPTSGSCNALIFGAASSVSSSQLALFLDLPFAPGLSYGGKIGLSVLSPVTASATAQGSAALAAKLKVAAQLQAKASVGVQTLPVQLELQAKFFAALTAQAALGIQAPKVSVAASACAKAAANLSANFGALCKLGAALERPSATLFVYSYSGAANGLGAAFSAVTGTTWGDGTTLTAGACTATVLAATDPLASAALAGFFGGA